MTEHDPWAWEDGPEQVTVYVGVDFGAVQDVAVWHVGGSWDRTSPWRLKPATHAEAVLHTFLGGYTPPSRWRRLLAYFGLARPAPSAYTHTFTPSGDA